MEQEISGNTSPNTCLPSLLDTENDSPSFAVKSLTTQDSFEAATQKEILEQSQTPPGSPFLPKIPGAVNLKPNHTPPTLSHLTRFRQQNNMFVTPPGSPATAPSLNFSSNPTTPASMVNSNASTPADLDNFFSTIVPGAPGNNNYTPSFTVDTPNRYSGQEFHDACIRYANEENTRYSALLSELPNSTCSSPAPTAVC